MSDKWKLTFLNRITQLVLLSLRKLEVWLPIREVFPSTSVLDVISGRTMELSEPEKLFKARLLPLFNRQRKRKQKEMDQTSVS